MGVPNVDNIAGGDCGDIGCHGDSGSHATHVSSNSKGPQPALACSNCHSAGSFPAFIDSNDLAGTQVCNPCHSPNGVFDGVDDPVIGSKISWDNGIYAGNDFLPGKEYWCLGCHDNVPANTRMDGSGINAPIIAGDNINYGFNINGHGRPGIVRDCLDCHDVTNEHIDNDSRTYTFDSSHYSPAQSGVEFAASYRLRYVNGEVPLMIPSNYNITFNNNAQLIRDNSARLCFDVGCHANDMANIFDDTPTDGISSNFKASSPDPPRGYSYAWGSGADINEHVSHLLNYIGPFWDSDWNLNTIGAGGGAGTGYDSMTHCSSCHNVHGTMGYEGSTNEVMIRDGSMTGRTGYGFSYLIEDTGSGGFPYVTSISATQTNSVGAIFRFNTNNMCGGAMCHGELDPPAGSSYDASGSSWGTYIEFFRPWQDY